MAALPIPILLYHSVCERPSDALFRWSISPDEFSRHLELIANSKRQPLRVSEFVERLLRDELPPAPVLVTFDDGYGDFATAALPRLQEFDISSTLYVTTGTWKGHVPVRLEGLPSAAMLQPDELLPIEDAGVEIGAHSVSHVQHDVVAKARVVAEIHDSATELESVLGHKVKSYAYPHGYSNAEVRKIVADEGFTSACAVRNAFSSAGDDIFGLARLTVERTTARQTLKRWLQGEAAPLATTGEALKTRVYRIYRRTKVIGQEVREGPLASKRRATRVRA